MKTNSAVHISGWREFTGLVRLFLKREQNDSVEKQIILGQTCGRSKNIIIPSFIPIFQFFELGVKCKYPNRICHKTTIRQQFGVLVKVSVCVRKIWFLFWFWLNYITSTAALQNWMQDRRQRVRDPNRNWWMYSHTKKKTSKCKYIQLFFWLFNFPYWLHMGKVALCRKDRDGWAPNWVTFPISSISVSKVILGHWNALCMLTSSSRCAQSNVNMLVFTYSP